MVKKGSGGIPRDPVGSQRIPFLTTSKRGQNVVTKAGWGSRKAKWVMAIAVELEADPAIAFELEADPTFV